MNVGKLKKLIAVIDDTDEIYVRDVHTRILLNIVSIGVEVEEGRQDSHDLMVDVSVPD